MNNKGVLVVADIYLGKDYSQQELKSICENAILHSGMNVVGYAEKIFEPCGYTGVWILSESHFSIHTYPEHRYISVDCYTCGDEGNPLKAIDALKNSLVFSSVKISQINRW